MRWGRALLLGVTALICLVLLLSGLLLFTPQGNQMIWQQLRSRVPGLQGELLAGQLGSGWEFADVGWQGETLGFSARRLRLDWTASRLLKGELVVNRLSGEGVRIELRYSDVPPADLPPPPETAAVNSMLVMPFPIRLQQLQVRDFLLTSPDVRVRVDALDTAATWYGDSLHVQASQSAGVDVELLPGPAIAAGQDVNSPPADQASTPTTALAPLPEVFIPLAIELDELSLARGRYHQRGFDTGLMDLKLSANFTGTRLAVHQLSVHHAWGEAALSGQMIFEQYYGLKAELEANSQLPWLEGGLKGRQLKLQAEGDLNDLGFGLAISGREKLQLDGRLSPLGKALPFSLKTHWQQLNWPLKGKAEYQAQAGKLSAEGSLEDYRLQLDSAVKLPEYPPIKLALKLTGNLEGIVLHPLRLTEGKTWLQADGRLNWRSGVDWQGILALDSEDIGRWRPELTGRLKGDSQSRFQWHQGGWQLALEQMQFSGVLNEYPLSLSGQLSGNDRQLWRFEQLSLKSGPNQLRVDGALTEHWDLRARLDAPKLATLYPPVSGNLQATAIISGPAKQPNVDLDLVLPELQGLGVRVSDLSLKGSASLAPRIGGRLMLKARQLRQGENRLRDLQLSLDGDEKDHRLKLQFQGSPLAGQLELAGSWQAGAWQGQLQQAWLDTDMGRWALERPLRLASQQTLSSWQLGEHCWHSQADRLCFEAARLSPERGDLGFRLHQLTTARLKPWYPPRFNWQSRLQGQGRLGWQQGRPRLAVSLETGPGVLMSDNLSSDYRMLSLNLQLDEHRGELGLRFDSAALGQARLDVGLDEPLGARRLNGSVALENLRLYGIAPLVDELHRTTGRVDANGRLAGTLDAPLFYGQVRLREGELDTSQDLVSIRQLQALLNIDGTRANLQGSLRMGKGELALRGFMDWHSGQPLGELTLSGTGLLVRLGGYGQATANPQLRLSFGQELRLMGTVVIPRARIEVKSLPEDVVDVSEDVIIVRPQQPEPTRAAPLPFYLNLKLLLGSDVRLTALGLKTRLTGSLDLTQSPGHSLSGRGQINLVEGRYKAYGQNLQIRSGRLLFSGNLAQPYLAVEAIRDPAAMEDENVTVGVRVSGLASAPEVKLFSEPELSDTDKLSYLLRGKSSSATGSGSSNEAMTAMLLGAGLGQAGGVLSDITESLGLQDVTLDTAGSGTDTQVSVSGKLLPGLQVQYGVGVFTSISEVKIRLELMPRLYLQAVSGLNQAVDLFYKFEF